MSDTDLGQVVIQRVDWSRYWTSTGSPELFGNILSKLLQAGTPDESREVWNGIENSVFAQDTIFSAVEPTIDVIPAALVEDRP
ncbi:hypothetical protein Rhe02_56870 [Rhizocola hellebori]|uniref:Uncharacterized protein n=1 Tax=Rhizocola hellebori TaxID=1392758 RepID=A0A8J3QBL7_9ACTN|nr:hypothetical protein Rhe02_56870 [Rhizocola hellebori]